jgi:hypothetical protein
VFDNDFDKPTYTYYQSEAIIEKEIGSYADTSTQAYDSITWNHGLAEVMTALIESGLVVKTFQEYDYSPYNCFKHTIEVEKGKFQISKMQGLIPLVYSIEAVKNL